MQFPSSHPMAIIQRARINPKSLTHADVMQLQRTIGNRAVGRLLTEIGLIPSTAKQAQPIQMQTIPEEEEEPLQGKFAEPIQRQEIPEEEEPLQGKFENKPEQEICPSCSSLPIQREKENLTGMPDNLKAGVESLSGIDMSDVRVHFNSSKPAKVGALAYTQGTNIHISPGREKHLPHEAWHVVQQAQGRVQPTMQLKNVAVNDEGVLEREADVMGSNALKHERKMPKKELDTVSTMKGKFDSTHLTKDKNKKPAEEVAGFVRQPEVSESKYLSASVNLSYNKRLQKVTNNNTRIQQFNPYQSMTNSQERICSSTVVQRRERLVADFRRKDQFWVKTAEMIESENISTFVHINRQPSQEQFKDIIKDPDYERYSVNQPPEPSEVVDGGRKRKRVLLGDHFSREHFTRDKNVHITLEGRYMDVMSKLLEMSDMRETIKLGEPTGRYDNLDFGGMYEHGGVCKSDYSIQQWIENVADITETRLLRFIDSEVALSNLPQYKDAKPEERREMIETNNESVKRLIEVLNEVKTSTLNYTNHLIESTRDLQDMDAHNKLVHYGGNPWRILPKPKF
jgi:hypothetical protein